MVIERQLPAPSLHRIPERRVNMKEVVRTRTRVIFASTPGLALLVAFSASGEDGGTLTDAHFMMVFGALCLGLAGVLWLARRERASRTEREK
jgi:hypothetical protein